MLSKDSILSASDSLKPVPFNVPELGGDIFIRVMTGEQREEYEDALDGHRDTKGRVKVGIYRAIIAVHSICNADNSLMFDMKDIAKIAKLPSKALMRIAARTNVINSLTDDDVDAIAKNSASIPASDSGTS